MAAPAAASAGPPPGPLRVMVREPDGISLMDYVPATGLSRRDGAPKIAGSAALFSPEGHWLAVTTPDGVKIYDVETGAEVAAVAAPGVAAVSFSNTSRYLQTWQKPGAAADDKNLVVWALPLRAPADGPPGPPPAPVLRLPLKKFSRDAWPTLQFSTDDASACRAVTNEAHFYDTASWATGVARKLRAPGLATGCLSPGLPPSFAGFFPESKGAPASARAYPVPSTSDESPTPTARRTFFRASECRFAWNVQGSAALASASSDVDKTNQSYYGESSLHFLRADGGLDCGVPLSKEGPVHDAKWSPAGTHFVAVYGFMPAKATVFDLACTPVYELGAGPQNCVFWSPSGRFAATGGFGNLPGDLSFFDRKPAGKFAPMGAARAPCTVTAEWSPCGRYLLAATTAPRLRVDNGLKVFRYNGDLLAAQKHDVLLEAAWQPAPKNAHPDRPQSPGRATGTAPSDAPVLASGAAKKAAPYRPPGASGAAGAFSLGALAVGEGDGPGKVGAILRAGIAARAAAGPPGAQFVEPSPGKTKRRGRKKGEAASGGGEELGEGGEGASADATVVAVEGMRIGGDDAPKKLRAAQKKLRLLEELKAKASMSGTESLAPEQRAKLGGGYEAGLRAEIAAAGAEMSGGQ